MSKGRRKDTTVVRIGRATHRLLKVEAAKRGEKMNELAEKAVRSYLGKSE